MDSPTKSRMERAISALGAVHQIMVSNVENQATELLASQESLADLFAIIHAEMAEANKAA